MPFVPAVYESVMEFFNNQKESKVSDSVPEQLRGVWSLDNIGGMSIMMSFNNTEINTETRVATVRLYEKGHWLFRENNFFVKHLCKFLQYTYEFHFNEDYTHADIYLNLGTWKIRLPKRLMDWTLEFKDGKAIRVTKMFGTEHTYESERIESVEDLNKLALQNFYYC